MSTVSLVLATYGRSDDLGRMLESLASQTDRGFEVIIVDQNPDDRISEYVQRGTSAGLSINHVRKDRPGLSSARNAGIAVARGDLVGFPDDDCWYESDTIAQVKRAFDETPGLAGVVGNWVEQTAGTTVTPLTGYLSHDEWHRFRGRGASSISLFFRRQVVDALHGFDERLGVGRWYGAGEETDLLLRVLANHHAIMNVPNVRVHHAFSPATQHPLRAACLSNRKRGRGTGAIYAKHRMSRWTIFRGIVGQVLKPALRLSIRQTAFGFYTALGSIEGMFKWRRDER